MTRIAVIGGGRAKSVRELTVDFIRYDERRDVETAVTGAFAKDRQAIQAGLLSGAILTLPQVRAMTDELFEEDREYTAGWPAD